MATRPTFPSSLRHWPADLQAIAEVYRKNERPITDGEFYTLLEYLDSYIVAHIEIGQELAVLSQKWKGG